MNRAAVLYALRGGGGMRSIEIAAFLLFSVPAPPRRCGGQRGSPLNCQQGCWQSRRVETLSPSDLPVSSCSYSYSPLQSKSRSKNKSFPRRCWGMKAVQRVGSQGEPRARRALYIALYQRPLTPALSRREWPSTSSVERGPVLRAERGCCPDPFTLGWLAVPSPAGRGLG